MKILNVDDLYVVCPVMKDDILIEPFIQYESFGKEYHEITINPKKILVIKSQENGKVVYHDVSTGIKIDPVYYSSSYKTKSSCSGTVHCMNLEYPRCMFSGLTPLFEESVKRYEENHNMLGYAIPFKEYIENTLHISISTISLVGAKTLIRVTNASCDRPFKLSENYEEAKKQIDTKVLRKEKKRSQE